ncbi:MAG: alanine racemase [Clostridia bacterium]|nr:alanine racemase [Clostridia bacterium]
MLNKAIIDLNKLKFNALEVKKKLPKNVKFCAVVKANAYGHGAEMISNSLYSIVDCFAVALVEEGISLRLSGIDKEILVLVRAGKSDLEKAIRYDLTLTACSIFDLININKECIRQNKKVSVHIKYNTGMNRQGVNSLSDLRKMLSFASKNNKISIDGLYSHYACPENQKMREKATNKFLLAISLVKGYNKNAICHISASGGFLFNQYFDMVRIGILLYGYKPFDTQKIKVKPIMKLYSPCINKRKVKKGEYLLYGRKKLKKSQEVSLIRFGYADGLDRQEVNGQKNNRCMDLTAVCGRHYKINVLSNVESMAKKYKTISYEILVKSTIRAEKIYKN